MYITKEFNVPSVSFGSAVEAPQVEEDEMGGPCSTNGREEERL
jgi:hypothetical protein